MVKETGSERMSYLLKVIWLVAEVRICRSVTPDHCSFPGLFLKDIQVALYLFCVRSLFH